MVDSISLYFHPHSSSSSASYFLMLPVSRHLVFSHFPQSVLANVFIFLYSHDMFPPSSTKRFPPPPPLLLLNLLLLFLLHLFLHLFVLRGAVAHSVKRTTPGEEVPGSIPAVAAHFLLVGSVSVLCDRLRQTSRSPSSVSCVTKRKIVRRSVFGPVRDIA